MELIRPGNMQVLSNPGVQSTQLLNPANSASPRLTLTRVVVEPGAENVRHVHETSEQVWVALKGRGVLLLADGGVQPFEAGEVARFAEGEVHGFRNDSSEPFEYISATSPPIDFGPAYKSSASQEGG